MQVQKAESVQWNDPIHTLYKVKLSRPFETSEIPENIPVTSIQEKCAELGLPILRRETIQELFALERAKNNDAVRWKKEHKYTIVSFKNSFKIYIHLPEKLPNGSSFKVRRAMCIEYKSTTGEAFVSRKVKYAPTECEKQKETVERRIIKGSLFPNSSHLLQIDYWCKLREKVFIYADGLTTDLYNVFNHTYETGIKIPQSSMLKLLLDLGHGLKELHEKKIVHRDLKTENIMIDGRTIDGQFVIDRAVIGDPDFAMSEEEFRKEPLDSGSFTDLSPERIFFMFARRGGLQSLQGLLGLKNYSEVRSLLGIESDIWALGNIVYAYTKGTPPPWTRPLYEINGINQKLLQLQDQPHSPEKTKLLKKLYAQIEGYKIQIETDLQFFAKIFRPTQDDFFGNLTKGLLKIKPCERLTIDAVLDMVQAQIEKQKTQE